MTAPITVSTDLLEAVAKWAMPENETRLHLSQIVFRDDEMIATDGTRAVRVPIATHGHVVGLWRADALTAIAAQDASVMHDRTITTRRRGRRTIAIAPADARRLEIRLAADAGNETPLLIVRDCREEFPLDVLRGYFDGSPTTPAPGEIAFNPAFIAAIDDVKRAVTGDDEGVRIVKWGGPLDPMIFESAFIDDHLTKRARFAVMPMRF